MGTVAVSSLTTATQPNPNADVLVLAQGAVTHKLGVGQIGGLLTVVTYAAGTDINVTSGTAVDADATNLKVTFTAPPSGAVLVQLRCMTRGSGGSIPYFNLRDSVGDIANTTMYGAPSTSGSIWACSPQVIVTGLTAGTVYTWKWGMRSAGGANVILIGGAVGTPTMVVWALPG